MKTLAIAFLVLVVFLTVAVNATIVYGAGGSAPGSSLWNSIDEQGFNFSYGTSTAGGKTNFSSQMANADRLSSVSIYMARDTADPTRGWVSANFYGIVGDKPSEMQYESQSTNINRHGFHYSSNVGLGSYQEVLSWSKDGKPIYGYWLSSASTSMTFFDVIPTYASMNYDEYTDDWSGTKYYNGSVQWQVKFSSAGTTPVGLIGATVPEPATLSLLGMGVLGLLAKRRNKHC